MDNLVSLIAVTFATFGFAYIVGYSQISFPFRVWLGRPQKAAKRSAKMYGLRRYLVDLLQCPACISFHVGLWLLLAAFMLGLFSWNLVFLPLYLTGTSYILAKYTELI